MLRLLSDEDFNGRIVRGLLRRQPSLDLIRVQDVGLMQTPDPDVLEWAAKEGRQLLSHDTSTMSAAVMDRLDSGKPMPGCFSSTIGCRLGRPLTRSCFTMTLLNPRT